MSAYDEYITPILAGANREKYEWAVGSALSGGPEKSLIICAESGTGKSELLNIIKWVFVREGMPSVIIREGLRYMNQTTGYVYMTSLHPITSDNTRHIVMQNTGYLHPHEDYYRLYEAMQTEVDLIANACVDRYIAMGSSPYENLTTNNL